MNEVKGNVIDFKSYYELQDFFGKDVKLEDGEMFDLFGNVIKIEAKKVKQKNLNKKFYYYFSPIMDEEQKKELMQSFKTTSLIKRNDLNNYMEIVTYEKGIKHNFAMYAEEIKEIKRIEVGTLDWFNNLSKNTIDYLNEYVNTRYKEDVNRFENGNEMSEDLFTIKTQAVEFYLRSNFDTYYLDKNNELTNECEEMIYKGSSIKLKDKLFFKCLFNSVVNENLDNLKIDDNGNLTLSDNAFLKYVINEEPIQMTEEEVIYQSMLRTYKKFKEMILCNTEKFKHFLTLTFANINELKKYESMIYKEDEYKINFKLIEDPTNYDLCVKCLTKFLNRIKKELKKRDLEFYYVGVPEYQKNGNIHYHFLTSEIPDDMLYEVPMWLDVDYYAKRNNSLYIRRNDVGVKLWLHGKSVIEEIKNNARVSTYLAKYMQKSLYNLDSTTFKKNLNKKRYYNSNNLVKPKVDYLLEEKEIEYCSKFSFEKFNSFNDSKIKSTLYQLKKL